MITENLVKLLQKGRSIIIGFLFIYHLGKFWASKSTCMAVTTTKTTFRDLYCTQLKIIKHQIIRKTKLRIHGTFITSRRKVVFIDSTKVWFDICVGYYAIIPFNAFLTTNLHILMHLFLFNIHV